MQAGREAHKELARKYGIEEQPWPEEPPTPKTHRHQGLRRPRFRRGG